MQIKAVVTFSILDRISTQHAGKFKYTFELHATLAALIQGSRAGFQPSTCSASALHEGAQTLCDLPSTCRVRICERRRCLPHMKQDMVAPLNDAEARKGEPEGLDL